MIIEKNELIKFVRSNEFAFCYNAGREVCNTGINNYDLCVDQVVESIEKANFISEADDDMKSNFVDDTECTIYQAGEVAIAYYDDNGIIRAIIKQAMSVRNIKQTELAEKIGVTKSTMSLFINSKMNLGQDKIEAIFEFLGIELRIKE